TMSTSDKISRGGCHCGAVAFEVEGRPERAEQCNCSICSKKGYLHWIVPRESFHLLTAMENLATYVPRSHPDRIDVNVRCLEGFDPAALEVEQFDGANWEQAIVAYRAARK